MPGFKKKVGGLIDNIATWSQTQTARKIVAPVGCSLTYAPARLTMHVMNPVFVSLFILLFAHLITTGSSQGAKDWDSLENYCLDAQNHKIEPGEEDALHKQVTFYIFKKCIVM